MADLVIRKQKRNSYAARFNLNFMLFLLQKNLTTVLPLVTLRFTKHLFMISAGIKQSYKTTQNQKMICGMEKLPI